MKALLFAPLLLFTPTPAQAPTYSLPETPAEMRFYVDTMHAGLAGNIYYTNGGGHIGNVPDSMRLFLSNQLEIYREAQANVR